MAWQYDKRQLWIFMFAVVVVWCCWRGEDNKLHANAVDENLSGENTRYHVYNNETVAIGEWRASTCHTRTHTRTHQTDVRIWRWRKYCIQTVLETATGAGAHNLSVCNANAIQSFMGTILNLFLLSRQKFLSFLLFFFCSFLIIRMLLSDVCLRNVLEKLVV